MFWKKQGVMNGDTYESYGFLLLKMAHLVKPNALAKEMKTHNILRERKNGSRTEIDTMKKT